MERNVKLCHILHTREMDVIMKWKLVPVEPTDEMLTAGECTYWHCGGMSEPVCFGDGQYEKILAAAPDPTQDDALVAVIANAIFFSVTKFKPDMDDEDDAYMVHHEYSDHALAVLAALKGGE